MWRLVIVLIALVVILAPTPASPSPGADRTAERQLAFTRAGDIWTIGADGTRARALLRDAYAPSWSPDGTRLAFVSRRSGDEEIYVAGADGTGVRRLTKLPGPDLSPAWSSSGRRLAWSHNAEIWTMSASGAGKRRLVGKTAAWHEHHSPTWHGAALVYSSTRVSAFDTELFRAPARRLTFTKGSEDVFGDDAMPDFFPDGRRIAFTSNRDQQGEIYVMNADGRGQKRLTRRAGDDWAPDVSPDGARIAFTQLPGTIWTMNADGTGLRKLTAGTDADWRP